ncbi:MAG: hypothetical protein JRI23_16900 [Deltaproteobacteria bacterium]|jgi:hypothetical protein|nr:hypothetical protein [Deltaproteobacteria bacterium]MBW2533483.1 hypothetical protein [Deltaproteobacteria bacterium]
MSAKSKPPKPKRKSSPRSGAKAPSRWRRRLKRALVTTAVAVPVLGLLLWIGVHRIPWLGPALADGLRSVIGPKAVSRLQDLLYGAEDRWKRYWREGEQPKAYWEVPDPDGGSTSLPGFGGGLLADGSGGGGGGDAAPQRARLPKFVLSPVGPMFETLAAKGDGVWVPVVDPYQPKADTAIYKTLLHPDRKRPWAELFVIALDLSRLEIHPVVGRYEPRSLEPGSHEAKRPAVVPSEHRHALIAAFNGGFKAEHGHWGMRVGGVTFIRPRKHGCTVTRYQDGSLSIDPWHEIEARQDDMLWWRQTPPCMYRSGTRHGSLWDPDAKGWGAALEGGTVIRRSAIGLTPKRDVLYVSVSNDTNARAIADGMHHVGCVDVAQLDVNWSYPKIVLFPRGADGQREPQSLFDGFKVDEGEYLREPSPRDFFYVTRRELE